MANYTKNYGLIKPLGTEKVSIDSINENMDKIDTQLKNLENIEIEELTEADLDAICK